MAAEFEADSMDFWIWKRQGVARLVALMEAPEGSRMWMTPRSGELERHRSKLAAIDRYLSQRFIALLLWLLLSARPAE